MKRLKQLDKLILLFFLFSFAGSCAQVVFPVLDNKTHQYGLKNSSGNWILKPEYRYIQPFYSDQGEKWDSVTIVQKAEFYMQSNIVVKVNFGLVNDKGKTIIPLKYKNLIRNKSIFAAGTFDNSTIILNRKNEKISELKGVPQRISDSILFVFNEEDQSAYFTNMYKINKLTGPLTYVDFYDKTKLIGETISKERAFYNKDGSVYLRNDSIYTSNPVLLQHDLFLIKNNDGITFSDRSGKLYNVYYQNLTGGLNYCNKYADYGDYRECKDARVIDVEKIYKYYGFEPPIISTIKSKEPKYDVIRTFSKDDYGHHNRVGNSLNEYKEVKYRNPENKINYSILNDSDVILNSEFPIENFYMETALARDPETNKYYLVKKNKIIEINQKQLEDIKNLGIVYFTLSYKSKNNVIKIKPIDDYSNAYKLFIINENGNIEKVKGNDMTNFYNGFAYLNDNGKLFLIDENLKRLKEIPNLNNVKYGSLYDFDNNGIIIYRAYKNNEDSNYKGILNYKGQIIIPETVDEIYKENSVFYISYSKSIKNENGYYDFFVFDKSGKKIAFENKADGLYFSYAKNYFVLYYDYTDYYYYYSGEYLGSDRDGLNWNINERKGIQFR